MAIITKNVRFYQGADNGTDHSRLVGKVQIKFKEIHQVAHSDVENSEESLKSLHDSSEETDECSTLIGLQPYQFESVPAFVSESASDQNEKISDIKKENN